MVEQCFREHQRVEIAIAVEVGCAYAPGEIPQNQVHPNADGYSISAASMVDGAVDAATRDELCDQVPPGPCSASSTVLCLNQGRFRLEATWESFSGDRGTGTAVPLTDDTAAFYWFSPQNIELIIKVIDGRGTNGYFWVFYAPSLSRSLSMSA